MHLLLLPGLDKEDGGKGGSKEESGGLFTPLSEWDHFIEGATWTVQLRHLPVLIIPNP